MSCCDQNRIVYPPCPSTCPEVIEYTVENGNLTGIGVYDNTTSQLVQMRGVVGDGTYITTSLDAANKAILISLDAAAISGGVPQATEALAGKAEIATQAETNAGASDTTIVTPLKLATRTATDSRTGVIELATQAEVDTGTDAVRAVTPVTLSTLLATKRYTTIFADAVSRGAAVPAFQGQIGTQIDTNLPYVANGVGAGDWYAPWMLLNTVLDTAGTSTVTGVNLLLFDSFEIQNSGSPVFTIDNSGTLTIELTTTFNTPGSTTFNTDAAFAAEADFQNVVNLATGSTVTLNGTLIPANSVVVTSGTAGDVSSRLLNTFISTANTQAGWGNPTGTLTRTAFDTATVTTAQLAERVAALITDLKARLLPAT